MAVALAPAIPQLMGGGPQVLVRNTFVDLDCDCAAQVVRDPRRSKTSPALRAPLDLDLDLDEDLDLDLDLDRGLDSSASTCASSSDDDGESPAAAPAGAAPAQGLAPRLASPARVPPPLMDRHDLAVDGLGDAPELPGSEDEAVSPSSELLLEGDLPQFVGGGPQVLVRNTFVDLDCDCAAQVVRDPRRSKTSPALRAPEVAALDLDSPGSTCASSSDDDGESLAAVPASPAAAPAPAPRQMSAAPVPASMGKDYLPEDGLWRMSWAVDARKLRSSDKQAVSPSLELCLGDDLPPLTFKLIIHPTALERCRGGFSFKKAAGRGHVQLKCESELPKAATSLHVEFYVGNGAKAQPPRGPVRHNFSTNALCCLPPEMDEWDFAAAVDERSATFTICALLAP